MCRLLGTRQAMHGRGMRIGIIGTGNMGRTLGALWAELGHEELVPVARARSEHLQSG